MQALVKVIGFLPVIAFFISYRVTSDLVLATAIVVAGCLIAAAVELALTRKVSRMQIFLTAAVLVFGIPTVLLKDPEIIKWKVTVVNLILAGLIFVFQFLMRRNPLEYMLGEQVRLPSAVWLEMSAAWMLFFTLAAGLNVIIAFCLPTLFGIDEKTAEGLWVDYKAFGNAILNFVFAIASTLVIFRRHPGALEDFAAAREGAKQQTKEH
ncbi:MAG: septation protein IspZ [Succinivibrionaceae bacterium]|nr:septation protein IspZ [Succinivibrionaceae bacterium]